jgi:nicotinamide riboside transporter PnuC
MTSIINYIKTKLKTKEGRRLLFIEGIVLMIAITGILIVTPKEITISGHVGLLTIVYIIASLYMIVRKYTNKDSDNKESKE